ncbi:YqhR family membrane protein [Virgibacillus soli]|uniref:YqhR family membrane protein n=1 Tax=Paracerasibacillus soli TaxID=480284 RepID=A0ABU5CSM2_9BACI|nr:YqhR family membrane protein [Virgibacillus soli]MDY0408413.1 YqhR family membrane protein [Virgibacillus soli]
MSKQLQVQEKNTSEGSLFLKSLSIGFVGGLFWSSIGVFLYYFNMSEVAPKSFLLRSWITESWTEHWLGHVISIILTGILSMVASTIYYGILRKTLALWTGIVYGLVLWGVIFFVLHPLFMNVPAIHQLDMNTIVSTLSLYVLYGLFIGYSISYHYSDVQSRKEVNN